VIGAAHGGCFSMALSLILNEAEFADVAPERVADGCAIASFGKWTTKAKSGCSDAKVLRAKIGLDASS
jgi:organic hydroperoxide reductase OsmC/OhrA